jgi:hypothetical protein
MGADHQAKARKLTEWQKTIPGRFNTCAIKHIEVSGLEGNTVYCGKPFSVKMQIVLGEMAREELRVQMLLGVTDGANFTEAPQIIELGFTGEADGVLTYEAECTAKANGLHAYGLRVVPCADPMDHVVRAGLVHWA